MGHMHTYTNNSDDGHRASARAVRVVQLFYIADSRTERSYVRTAVTDVCGLSNEINAALDK